MLPPSHGNNRRMCCSAKREGTSFHEFNSTRVRVMTFPSRSKSIRPNADKASRGPALAPETGRKHILKTPLSRIARLNDARKSTVPSRPTRGTSHESARSNSERRRISESRRFFRNVKRVAHSANPALFRARGQERYRNDLQPPRRLYRQSFSEIVRIVRFGDLHFHDFVEPHDSEG